MKYLNKIINALSTLIKNIRLKCKSSCCSCESSCNQKQINYCEDE